jgi:UDP-glucose:(heptosyl)LPS alpha-1,3-glucosyltransferase
MNIALCYESVLPARGGAETYIGDLARRLASDGHIVHLYACRWDANSLPASTVFHQLDVPRGPRFLRPWRFGRAVEKALAANRHDVSVGFDKTWGQDVLYPQGGLHAASAAHNKRKFANPVQRVAAAAAKWFDLAAWSFARLERKQYLGEPRSVVVVNSRMVQRHFAEFVGIGPERLRVVH